MCEISFDREKWERVAKALVGGEVAFCDAYQRQIAPNLGQHIFDEVVDKVGKVRLRLLCDQAQCVRTVEIALEAREVRHAVA